MGAIQFGMGGMGGMGLTGSPDGPVGFDTPDDLSATGIDYTDAATVQLAMPPLIKSVTFADRCWDAQHLSQAVLGEFAAFPWQKDPAIMPKDWRGNDIDLEIKQLIKVGRDNRRKSEDEILAQAEDATNFWANLLMANPVSCPATWTLIYIGEAVGMMMAMYFKHIHRRPRPVQVYPPLMPLLLTPPHASYPNAHALQSNLMSCLVAQVRPELTIPLKALALRVGQNREIAGVHYPSDRIASEQMIDGIMKYFDQLKSAETSAYAIILRTAEYEWRDIASAR